MNSSSRRRSAGGAALLAALALTLSACSTTESDEDSTGEEAAPEGQRGRPAPEDRTAADPDPEGRTEQDSAPDAAGSAEVAPPTGHPAPGLTVTPCDPDVCGPPPGGDPNTFDDVGQALWLDVADAPTSTFGLDVDTASYRTSVAMVDYGEVPPGESVRIEEWVNAFDYGDAAPTDAALGLTVESAPAPRGEAGTQLIRVGVAAEEVSDAERAPVSLTLVVDVSGSMQGPGKLDLVRESLAMMTDQLRDDDTVAIVTYADGAHTVLPPTPMSERAAITGALDELYSNGSTSVEAGLTEGYEVAAEGRREGATDVVLLASDGVANQGVTDPDSLVDLISGQREDGIALVTAGFGMDGINDTLMEQLSRTGDGFYAYVDSREEAERLFVDDLTSTLVTVARDTKIQVAFDAGQVESYRLLGYQNRALEEEDFTDDTVDAGELGAGHRVSALYEVVPTEAGAAGGDLGEVALRWADPETDEVSELREPLGAVSDTQADESLRLAAVVADSAGVVRGDRVQDEREVDLAVLIAEADALAGDGVDGADGLGDLLTGIQAAGGPVGIGDQPPHGVDH